MDSKCGYLVVSVGVLSWVQTMYYSCSFLCLEPRCRIPTVGGPFTVRLFVLVLHVHVIPFHFVETDTYNYS